MLVNPELGGVTLGWRLTHTAQDELFAAIEGTAFHTRVILERMEEHGVPVQRVINGGGIPQKNEVLNQVYANVLDKPMLVPKGDVTSLGSAIFAFLAAGTFQTIEEAQDALCPGHRVSSRTRRGSRVYEELYPLYRKLYFAFGERQSAPRQSAMCCPSCADRRDKSAEEQDAGTRCELKSSKRTSKWCAAAWCSTPSATPAASRAKQGLVAIKPSGVPYEELTPADMVITDLDGRVVEGKLRPSSDLPTHVALYRAFPQIGGVVHTHSRHATAWAQAGREIPCFGTTHADYFGGPVPVTAHLSPDEIESAYELNTGVAIIRRLQGLEPAGLSRHSGRRPRPLLLGRNRRQSRAQRGSGGRTGRDGVADPLHQSASSIYTERSASQASQAQARSRGLLRSGA